MELRHVLAGVREDFYKEMLKKMKKKVQESYVCEMKCFQNSSNIEEADSCALQCSEAQMEIRKNVEGNFKTAFVWSKQKKLVEEIRECDKDEICARKSVVLFKGKLEEIIKTIE